MAQISYSDVFEPAINYPDVDAQDQLAALVGLDDHKKRLSSLLGILVNPERLARWQKRRHPKAAGILSYVRNRPPLVVLAGDVGSGKTALAESIGDSVARAERIDITLLPMSLSARGKGRVGEMTMLLSSAFEQAESQAKAFAASSGKSNGAVLLLVDEADALAQSREASQMHHEDRAGVNAFIRGVDRLARSGCPIAVIMCTNRISALDPAVKRRAAEILEFARPTSEQRRAVLERDLVSLGFGEEQITEMVAATGPRDGVAYGFTFSDLVQRLLPALILDAYPDSAVDPIRALAVAQSISPTPPFLEG